jgi:hypothetical protein
VAAMNVATTRARWPAGTQVSREFLDAALGGGEYWIFSGLKRSEQTPSL